ncbi:unnamed protein product [Brassica oleracea var. botrytis]
MKRTCNFLQFATVCMSLYPTVELLKGLRKKKATSKQLITTILFSFSTLLKKNSKIL